MTTRGMGWVPDVAHRAPYGAAAKPATDGADVSTRLEGYVRRGGDQEHTNSCVHWGYAGGLWVLSGVLELPEIWPSILTGYWSTRMLTARGRRDHVVDMGCRTADAAEVYRTQGFASEKKWPFVARNVDVEPPIGAFLTCMSQDWLRPQRVIGYGEEHARTIRAAIDAQLPFARPILRATRVDQAYLDWRPGYMPWSFCGPLLGRHLELCVSYDQTGIRRVSSWGDSFDRVESWSSVMNDSDSESWILDVDALEFGGLMTTLVLRGGR